jgi:hypothetical protein
MIWDDKSMLLNSYVYYEQIDSSMLVRTRT